LFIDQTGMTDRNPVQIMTKREKQMFCGKVSVRMVIKVWMASSTFTSSAILAVPQDSKFFDIDSAPHGPTFIAKLFQIGFTVYVNPF